MPRIVNGKPIDHTLTMRFAAIQDILTAYFPAVAENMFNKVAKGIQDKAFKLRPEWRFEPATSLKQSVPIVSDYLVSHLESGAIRSVAGIERISGPSSVQLSDGTTLEVDTIIWCTGYKTDFSFLNASYDPTKNITSAWAQSKGSNNKPLARLYQNIFSLRAPNSLAFLGTVAFPSPAFQAYDLATMAIAQVWKGASPLPGQAAMEEEVDAHHQWVISLAQRGTVYPGIVQPGPWMRWVNEAAGTGVNEMLGYGPKGWKFWWGDGKFCTMCYDGILSPHVFRVFEGKRKRWHGARQAIEKVNCK
jgi:dimethylaniline monooxygenase (N-oxide forming)